MISEKVACSSTSFSNISNTTNTTSEDLEDIVLDPENENMTLPEEWEYHEEVPEAHEYDDPENLDLGRRLSARRRYYSSGRRRYGGSSVRCRNVRKPITRYVQ